MIVYYTLLTVASKKLYLLNFLIGLGFASWSLIMTRAQELTDLDYQGRVLSSFNALSSVGMLLVYAALYFEGTTISLAHLYYVQVGFAAVSIFLLLKHHELFQ